MAYVYLLTYTLYYRVPCAFSSLVSQACQEDIRSKNHKYDFKRMLKLKNVTNSLFWCLSNESSSKINLVKGLSNWHCYIFVPVTNRWQSNCLCAVEIWRSPNGQCMCVIFYKKCRCSSFYILHNLCIVITIRKCSFILERGRCDRIYILDAPCLLHPVYIQCAIFCGPRHHLFK